MSARRQLIGAIALARAQGPEAVAELLARLRPLTAAFAKDERKLARNLVRLLEADGEVGRGRVPGP